jgi:splicing factor 3B subunit 2
MREAIREKEDQMKMRQKMRERVQPKMGKLNIDYQKLHDAFFKYQTKPELTAHGEMYAGAGLARCAPQRQGLTRKGMRAGVGIMRGRNWRPSTRTSGRASCRQSCGCALRRPRAS